MCLSQRGFQSGLETPPLASVCAGYCHFLGQFQAKSQPKFAYYIRDKVEKTRIKPISVVKVAIGNVIIVAR